MGRAQVLHGHHTPLITHPGGLVCPNDPWGWLPGFCVPGWAPVELVALFVVLQSGQSRDRPDLFFLFVFGPLQVSVFSPSGGDVGTS